MADNTNVFAGLKAAVQDHIDTTLTNNLFNIMPLLFFIAKKNMGHDGWRGLGGRKLKERFTGLGINSVEMEQVKSGVFRPNIQYLIPQEGDGKSMGMYDTMPSRSNWRSEDPTLYGATLNAIKQPYFKFCEFSDPIKVAKKPLQRMEARQAADMRAAITSVTALETANVMGVHNQRWQKLFWGKNYYAGSTTVPITNTGAPTNLDAETWDRPYSVGYVVGTSAQGQYYAGIDRSLLANSFFLGKRVTTARAADLFGQLDEAKYTLQMANKGDGLNIIITGGNVFRKYLEQGRVKNNLVYASEKAQEEFAQLGFTRDIIKVENTYIVYDPDCPSQINGDPYNVAVGLNLDTWFLAVNPKKSWTVDEFSDQSLLEGGSDALYTKVRTELMFGCRNPGANVYWENITA